MNIEEITAEEAKDLEYLKQFTSTPGNGCTRLPFTKEARGAVDYLRKIMEEAGLEVHEDVVGNVIGVLKGTDPTLPCVMMGSHYDSVTNGGDFDGMAGVICGIQVARILKEKAFQPKRNFVVVGFVDEEGLRFGTGYFGSASIVGDQDEPRDVKYCKTYKDNDGVSYYEAMKSYGLDPERIHEARWADGAIDKFIELHIEQGPVLDTEKIQLGLVEGIVGIQRYVVTVNGRADHAGTTPMDMRLDAVDAATKVISKIADWAREKADGTVATVGRITTIPGGMNIVAEKCEFTVDIRSMNNDNINDIANRMRAALDREVKEMGGSYEIEHKLTITPVKMSDEMLKIMEASCKEHEFSYKYLPSGAGHDALQIANQGISTVMLFVPSKDGRSHCPVEFTKYSDFARGTVVMSELAENILSR